LTNANGTLFFRANNGTNGYELWKSDGTEGGTVMVKDIYSGSSSSSPDEITNINGTLFFEANDGTNGNELWESDGTEVGTVMVEDINPGDNSSSPQYFALVNNTLFFSANDGYYGTELWSLLVDESAPSLTITLAPPNPTSDKTPTLGGTASDEMSVVSSVQYRVDSATGSWSACTADDGSFNESSEAFTCKIHALTDGPHTIYVRAIDSVGNTTSSGSYATDAFTVGTRIPLIFLTNLGVLSVPEELQEDPGTWYYTGHQPTLQGTTLPGAEVSFLIESDPMEGSYTANGEGNWFWTPPSPVPDGYHEVTITSSLYGQEDSLSFTLGINVGLAQTGGHISPLLIELIFGVFFFVAPFFLEKKSDYSRIFRAYNPMRRR
jgi:ELWxxDGT repeat protein